MFAKYLPMFLVVLSFHMSAGTRVVSGVLKIGVITKINMIKRMASILDNNKKNHLVSLSHIITEKPLNKLNTGDAVQFKLIEK